MLIYNLSLRFLVIYGGICLDGEPISFYD